MNFFASSVFAGNFFASGFIAAAVTLTPPPVVVPAFEPRTTGAGGAGGAADITDYGPFYRFAKALRIPSHLPLPDDFEEEPEPEAPVRKRPLLHETLSKLPTPSATRPRPRAAPRKQKGLGCVLCGDDLSPFSRFVCNVHARQANTFTSAFKWGAAAYAASGKPTDGIKNKAKRFATAAAIGAAGVVLNEKLILPAAAALSGADCPCCQARVSTGIPECPYCRVPLTWR